MSEPGDVVWADGQAWIRGTTAYGDHKAWWCHPLPVSGEVYRRLSEAEQADDFMWLVKDGIPIVLNALAVYQALDSFADFVAKRDADAELTAERDELRSRLADMTAQRDRAVAKGSELAADLVESERQHDEARDELKSVTTQRDHAVEGVAAMTKLRDAELDDNRITWRENKALREQLDKARGELADLQRLVAAAEANEPVLVHPDWRQAEFDELAEERDQLSQELATVLSLRQKLQRRFDDLNIKHNELRRQFDIAVNDRNILRARCDELERGDRHSCGFNCGQQEERRAVVAWLRDPNWADMSGLYVSDHIERGEHRV